MDYKWHLNRIQNKNKDSNRTENDFECYNGIIYPQINKLTCLKFKMAPVIRSKMAAKVCFYAQKIK